MSAISFIDFNFLGQISLNISMSIYLIWFLPQVFLNFKRKDTEGLSLGMHGILSIGYLCDLIYGWGLSMPLQYRLVTWIGLFSLAIQHYQIGRYGLHKINQKYGFIFLNIFYFLLLIFVFWALKFSAHARYFYDQIGMVSNICWLTYMLPQIIKNFINKSTIGLSPYFVAIAIFLNLCDSTSAWALDWDYPSKIGAPVAWFENLILLGQVFYYAKLSKFRR